MSPMHFDAIALLVMALAVIIVVCHDHTLGFFGRAVASFAGAMCFAQAMWLLGLWEPGPFGYPMPRLWLDLSFALGSLVRVRIVLAEDYVRRHRRRSYYP